MRVAHAVLSLSLVACGSKPVEPPPKTPDARPEQKAKRDRTDAWEKKNNPTKAFKRRLSLVWSNTGVEPPHRFVARAIPDREPDSGGWHIWDAKAQRFVTDRKEIMRLTFEDLCEVMTN